VLRNPIQRQAKRGERCRRALVIRVEAAEEMRQFRERNRRMVLGSGGEQPLYFRRHPRLENIYVYAGVQQQFGTRTD